MDELDPGSDHPSDSPRFPVEFSVNQQHRRAGPSPGRAQEGSRRGVKGPRNGGPAELTVEDSDAEVALDVGTDRCEATWFRHSLPLDRRAHQCAPRCQGGAPLSSFKSCQHYRARSIFFLWTRLHELLLLRSSSCLLSESAVSVNFSEDEAEAEHSFSDPEGALVRQAPVRVSMWDGDKRRKVIRPPCTVPTPCRPPPLVPMRSSKSFSSCWHAKLLAGKPHTNAALTRGLPSSVPVPAIDGTDHVAAPEAACGACQGKHRLPFLPKHRPLRRPRSHYSPSFPLPPVDHPGPSNDGASTSLASLLYGFMSFNCLLLACNQCPLPFLLHPSTATTATTRNWAELLCRVLVNSWGFLPQRRSLALPLRTIDVERVHPTTRPTTLRTASPTPFLVPARVAAIAWRRCWRREPIAATIPHASA